MTNKVLVVDDDPDALKMMAVKLKSENYEIEEALNGQEALEKLKEFCPDVILLDVMMPVMDGLETCQKIREIRDYSETPVIFITAKTEDWDVLKGYSTGCSYYLTKPIKLELMAETVKQALAS